MGILRVVTSLIRLLIVEKQVLLGAPTVKIKFFQIHDQSLWKTGCEWVYKISSVIYLLFAGRIDIICRNKLLRTHTPEKEISREFSFY